MRYTASAPVALMLFTALAAGCSGDSSSPTSPSANGATRLTADRIAGTWTLLSIQPAGETEQTVPSGATYELTLADGRVSARADCNVCAGALVVGGQTLTIGPQLACTRAACRTMGYEHAYVGILAGDSAARLDGASLTLSSSRGVLRLRR